MGSEGKENFEDASWGSGLSKWINGGAVPREEEHERRKRFQGRRHPCSSHCRESTKWSKRQLERWFWSPEKRCGSGIRKKKASAMEG